MLPTPPEWQLSVHALPYNDMDRCLITAGDRCLDCITPQSHISSVCSLGYASCLYSHLWSLATFLFHGACVRRTLH